MDNEPVKVQQEKKKSRGNKVLLIALIALVIVFVGGGVYYYQAKTATKHVLSASNTKPTPGKWPLERPQTPAPLNNRQKKELANGTATTMKKKLFEVIGGNYYFTPNKLTVNQGDTVTIIFLDRFGTHDFVIDSLHVRTPLLRPGMPGVVTFTADKKGTYEFSSSLPQDKQAGMKGTLVVQ